MDLEDQLQLKDAFVVNVKIISVPHNKMRFFRFSILSRYIGGLFVEALMLILVEFMPQMNYKFDLNSVFRIYFCVRMCLRHCDRFLFFLFITFSIRNSLCVNLHSIRFVKIYRLGLIFHGLDDHISLMIQNISSDL